MGGKSILGTRARGCAIVLMAAGMASTPAVAGEVANIGSAGLRFGTAGIALDYTYGINRYVDLRGGYHFGSYSRDQEEDGIRYNADLGISALAAMVDVKPFGGGFRITAGAFSSAPELELDANGRDDYEIGDATYTGDLVLDGDVDLGSFTPYLGFGWGGTTNATGFGASFDIGVMFTQSPDVTMAVNGRACDSTNAPCDPNGAEGFDVNDPTDPRATSFQGDLQREVENLEKEAEDYKLWPVLMLGLHWRF